VLPHCVATDLLWSTFGKRDSSGLLEDWVDFAVGLSQRDECLGEEAIARAMKKLDVKLTLDDDLLFDGELRLVDYQKTIFLRSSIEQSRRNFTLAHELGHAALFQLDPSLEQTSQEIERLCNLFAAELLLPAFSVRRETAVTESYVRAVMLLAAKSGASLFSVCIRMTECFGGAAGIAAADGRIIRRYGDVPESIELTEYLLRIASTRERIFRTQRVLGSWALETGFLESKYVYVLCSTE